MDLKAALQDIFCPPIPLLDAVSKKLGERWLGWDPDVLRMELAQEVGEEVPQENLDKLQAGRIAAITNLPWEDWHPFVQIALAFNGVPIDPDIADVLSPSHMAYAYEVLRTMKPDQPFASEVINLMAAMLLAQGIYRMPTSQDKHESTHPLGDAVNAALGVMSANGFAEPDDEMSSRTEAVEIYLEAKHRAAARLEEEE